MLRRFEYRKYWWEQHCHGIYRGFRQAKQINKELLISNRIDLLSYIDFSIDAEKEDDEQVYQLLHTDKETALKQYEDMMSSKEIKYWR